MPDPTVHVPAATFARMLAAMRGILTAFDSCPDGYFFSRTEEARRSLRYAIQDAEAIPVATPTFVVNATEDRP